MATQLDLQEQEQLDALKSFWKQYGNLVTWVLILVLGAYAGWNAWQYWQRDQGLKAGAMYEELDVAATAGDAERAGRIFADMKAQFPGAVFSLHGGLLAAKLQADKGQAEAARATLTWVAEQAKDDELKTMARLRLSALQAEAKLFDDALKTLAAATAPGFEGLVADRRGDVLSLQGKKDEARSAYQAAYKAMGEKVDYRRVVEAKLMALGVAPTAVAGVAGAASAASATNATAPATGASK